MLHSGSDSGSVSSYGSGSRSGSGLMSAPLLYRQPPQPRMSLSPAACTRLHSHGPGRTQEATAPLTAFSGDHGQDTGSGSCPRSPGLLPGGSGLRIPRLPPGEETEKHTGSPAGACDLRPCTPVGAFSPASCSVLSPHTFLLPAHSS